MNQELTLEQIQKRMHVLHTEIWISKNQDYFKTMNNLRSERFYINKAIPKLETKLEKYKTRLPELEKELKKNSRYRILNQQRKRKTIPSQ